MLTYTALAVPAGPYVARGGSAKPPLQINDIHDLLCLAVGAEMYILYILITPTFLCPFNPCLAN